VRVVGAAAIASAASVVIDNTVVGWAGSPTYAAPIKKVLAFHAENRAAVEIAVGLEALTLPLLLLFVTGLHGLVGRRGGAGADWSRLAVAAGATFSAVAAFYAVLWDGVVLSAGQLTEPSPVLELAWQMHAAAFACRATGDTKTKRSRRTLALPARCVDVLSEHSRLQARIRAEAGSKWVDLGLVFTTRYGTPLDSADVRRDFRAAIGRAADVDASQWTPRELRHSFVSLLSDSGVPIEEISRLVGHRSTVVTEVVYRKQLRPVLESGATVMDRLFAAAKEDVGGQFGGQEPSATDEPGSLAEGTGL
jgi:hypothetical protein